MEVPDWVWDELRPRTTGSAGLAVAMAILRHGTRSREGAPGYGAGHTRVQVKATMQQLAKMAGVSTRTAEGAVGDLVRLCYIRVVEAESRGMPRVFELSRPGAGAEERLEQAGAEGNEGSAEFSHGDYPPLGEHAEIAGESSNECGRRAISACRADSSRAGANGGECGDGGGGDPLTESRGEGVGISTSNTNPIPREQILRALRTIGVDSISALEARHGLPKIAGALRVLHKKMVETDIENPAGFLVSILGKWPTFDEPVDGGAFLGDLCDGDRMAALRRMSRFAGFQRAGAGREDGEGR